MLSPRVHAWLAASCFFAGGCADLHPELSSEVDVATKYVSRGAVLFDDPALEPSVTVTLPAGKGSWSSGAWANIDGTNRDGTRGQTSEVDLYVERAQPFGPVSVAVGLYQYLYPASGDDTTGEAYGSISYEDELVTPTFQLWYDYQEADGVYANFDLSRNIDLSKAWSLSLSVSSGWMSAGQAESYFGVDSDGFSDLTGSTALAWSASEAVGLTFSLNGARVLDEVFRDATEHPDNAWFVVGLQLTF